MILSVILTLALFKQSVQISDWNILVNKTHDWSIKYSHEFIDKFISIGILNNISIACNESILETKNGLQNLELWAIDMINSWGSFPPTGARIGTVTEFGSYDQCLAIDPNTLIEMPQYCIIDWRPPLPKPMPVHHNLHHTIDVLSEHFDNKFNKSYENVFKRYSEFASFFYWISMRTGICTPSKCSETDITSLAKGFMDSYGLELIKVRCETKPTETSISVIQVIAILFLVSVLVLTLTATLLDKLGSKKHSSEESSLIIDMFSIKQNLNCIFAKRTNESLACVHGIRVLSMVWIIFGHTTDWMNYTLFSRAFKAKFLLARIDIQFLYNGFYSVETFFFIGGMLTSYITFKLTRGQFSRFNTLGFLLPRLLRLTPQLMIFMLLTYLLPLGGWASGPIWNETVTTVLDKCSTNWWWNLIYIQNWFEYTEMCGRHTWYLACDMQFHWLSILFIIPLLYNSKFGILMTNLAILIGYVSTIIMSYYLDLPPGSLNTGRDEHFWANYFNIFYHRPLSHSSSYFIGFLFGFIVYYKKFIKLNMISRLFAMVLIITGILLCPMDTYYWNKGNPYNRLISALVYSTCHLIWPLSLAGLMWMCLSGNGGIINKILSAHIFTPFSRMTYSVYLTHAWILWIFVGTRRERIDTSMGEILYIFIHNLILAYLVGFLFALLFETPILRLQTLMKKTFYKSEENRENPENTVKLTDKTINNNNNDLA